MSSALLISLISTFLVSPANAFLNDNVIYGNDDRKEVNQITRPMIHLQTKAIGMMTLKYKLTAIDNEYFKFRTNTLKTSNNLCPGSRFENQPALGLCSGFLVSPDTLVTAGHCIARESDCRRHSWIFNFTSDVKNKIKKSNVF